jgi:hypothetical protein
MTITRLRQTVNQANLSEARRSILLHIFNRAPSLTPTPNITTTFPFSFSHKSPHVIDSHDDDGDLLARSANQRVQSKAAAAAAVTLSGRRGGGGGMNMLAAAAWRLFGC